MCGGAAEDLQGSLGLRDIVPSYVAESLPLPVFFLVWFVSFCAPNADACAPIGCEFMLCVREPLLADLLLTICLEATRMLSPKWTVAFSVKNAEHFMGIEGRRCIPFSPAARADSACVLHAGREGS